MKIQSFFFGDNGLKNISDKKVSGVNSEKKAVKVDSVKISGNVNELVNSEQTIYEVNPEYPPRTEIVKSVSGRIEQGDYNTKLLNSVAEKVADSPAVKDFIAGVVMNNVEKSGERTEKVELAEEHIVEGYYDNPAVIKEIADRLIDALGLSNEII